MKNARFLQDAIGQIDEELICAAKRFAQGARARKMWHRGIALAACLALVVTALLVMPTPVPEMTLSAEEMAALFPLYDNAGTQAYDTVCAPDPEALYLDPVRQQEYLPIYQAESPGVSEALLQAFIDKYLSPACHLFGVPEGPYTIQYDDFSAGPCYNTSLRGENGSIRFSVMDNAVVLTGYRSGTNEGMPVNGSAVSIKETDTDAQIREKLAPTIAYLNALFGKRYTQIKIYREYRSSLSEVCVYLYSEADTTLPSSLTAWPNTAGRPHAEEFFCLDFYDRSHSGGEIFLQSVSLNEAIEPWRSYFSVIGKGQMLSLREAEGLLEKGYVFGGYGCSLCKAQQAPVVFSDYDAVAIEYVTERYQEGKSTRMSVPFYTFYKYLSENSDGIRTYAKTYVPAIRVTGLEEYFSQHGGAVAHTKSGEIEIVP